MAFRFSDQSAALRRAADLYERTSFNLAVRQLHAQVLLQELNAPTVEEVAFHIDRAGLRSAAYLLRSTALSLDGRNAESQILRSRYLRRAAEIFERLAPRSVSERGRFEALSQSAACWSLAGYEANAVVLGRRIRESFGAVSQDGPSETDYYALTSALLERDVLRVERFAREREGVLARFEDWVIERLNGMQDETAAHTSPLLKLSYSASCGPQRQMCCASGRPVTLIEQNARCGVWARSNARCPISAYQTFGCSSNRRGLCSKTAFATQPGISCVGTSTRGALFGRDTPVA